ncbi:Hypothetical predicted protein [Lecanosticta acicola]|uniref:Bola-like protein n=1 Tax=Lecanosticta acicola TaxID=111012 RepID=A0AAI8Z4F0_9PEZI|nr:Hypothetical predicted protein [Lecanosticta acicola]
MQLSKTTSRFASASPSRTRLASTLLPRLQQTTSQPPLRRLTLNHPPSQTPTTTTRRSHSSSSSATAPGEEKEEAVHPPDYLDERERKVFDMIKESLHPTKLEVQDISGGCGSMYGIDIVSEKFRGLSVIKQHRLVNEILREEIKGWHGVQLKTKAP